MSDDDLGLHQITPDILTMYKTIGKIVGSALTLSETLIKTGAVPAHICKSIDEYIVAETNKIYNKNKYHKGIAFPCCINVNDIVCNHTDNLTPLKDGDIVKVDVGAHINGYMVQKAITIQLQAEPNQAIHNVRQCLDNIIKSHFKFGASSHEIYNVMAETLKPLGLKIVDGCVSHEIHQFIPDGKNVIGNPADFPKFDIGHNQVYVLDLSVSTGDGLLSETVDRPSIYKRNPDIMYRLKTSSGKTLYYGIELNHPFYYFTIPNSSSSQLLGIKEAAAHNLISLFPVYREKSGKPTITFKATILVKHDKIFVL